MEYIGLDAGTELSAAAAGRVVGLGIARAGFSASCCFLLASALWVTL